jgi:hypothetical protein
MLPWLLAAGLIGAALFALGARHVRRRRSRELLAGSLSERWLQTIATREEKGI